MAITYFSEHIGVMVSDHTIHTNIERKVHVTCPHCLSSLSVLSAWDFVTLAQCCFVIIGLYPHLVVLHVNASHPLSREHLLDAKSFNFTVIHLQK